MRCVAVLSGELYELDVRSGRFSHLGYFIDALDFNDADQWRVRYLYGINLSADERAIVGVPIVITIFLEEAGLPYRIIPIHIGKGEQFGKEFLEIAPNNRIPAIVDHKPADGGAPLALFESGAILQYLAADVAFA